MNLTRRETTGLLIASAAVTLVPSSAAAETAETLALKLGDALNGRLLRGCEGRFAVPDFELSGTRRNVIMQATVQLNWPPGMRKRPFHSAGGSQQEAIVAMFKDALREFGSAWPECIRT